MHNTKRVRSTLLSLIMAGALGVGFATGASAQVGARTGGGVGAEVGPSGAEVGGSADAHRNPSGSDSNAQWKTDSTRGEARAEERRSDGGTEAEATGGTTTTTP